MSRFQDHFSGHAGSYAAHRPVYPDALFRYLSSCCRHHDLAWDCATGNGQAARSLLPYFRDIVATDASAEQIGAAPAVEGIEFRVARAEDSGLQAGTVDLVTVAQALHWFDIDAFFAEASRVLKPGGLIAFWCYKNCGVAEDVDPVLQQVFDEVENYWPPERAIVEDQYPHIRMPFGDLAVRDFSMTIDWTVDEVMNYMRTWSASQRYMAAEGRDPVAVHEARLRSRWGEGSRTVRWPLVLRVGRKSGA